MDHIIQRTSGYYFRLAVPSDLRDSIGTREIKRSLQTRSLSLAKERSRLISGRLKKFYRILRRQNLKLTPEQIEDIIEQYIEEGLDNIENDLLPKHRLSPESVDNMIEGTEDVHSMAVEDLITFNYKAVRTSADGFLVQRAI